MEKICFICNVKKPLQSFYAHSQMKDGHLNKCKECTKTQEKSRFSIKRKNSDFIEKEKERSREKYYRLYRYKKINPLHKKNAMENYKNKYPEKIKAKNMSNKIVAPNNFEKHHWSYNLDDAKDVIFLSKNDHYKAHRFIIYDQERMKYRRCDNLELLDSKQNHLDYINDCILNK